MATITITTLNKMKRDGEKIVMLTSYDASFAQLSEEAEVDILLIGDSLGMVVQGYGSTLPVSVEDMVYHTANVTRVSSRALIVADMPFMSHGTPKQALDTAGRLMKEGHAHMVKIEGGAPQIETVRHLTERAVPVCGHLGLMPQSIHQLGGYRVQGRSAENAQRIRNDARALQEAGAQLLVLECIPQQLAAEITNDLDIPVIGIGAGKDCDGQVLVVYDMLGITPSHQTPSFVRDFLAETGSVTEALKSYVRAVREGSFPAPEHWFT